MTQEQFENFINAMMVHDISAEDTKINVNKDDLSSQIETLKEKLEDEKGDEE